MSKGGNKMAGKNILFVCSANVKRSPSAEYWFSWAAPGNNYTSRGASKFACKKYGGNFVSANDLENADRIICMEKRNQRDIEKEYGKGFDSKIEVAGIQDNYNFLDLELIFEFMDSIKII